MEENNTPVISFSGADILGGDNVVVYGLDLQVFPGQLVYILGKVGSGKTSIFRTITAENRLGKGSGQVCGYDLATLRGRDVPQLRRRIGVVFQDFQLLMDRTVEDNLSFVLRSTGWKDRAAIAKRIDEVLAAVGMTTKAHKMPHQLSGGEQQRIAIGQPRRGARRRHPPAAAADQPRQRHRHRDGHPQPLHLPALSGTHLRNARRKLPGDYGMTLKQRSEGILGYFRENVPVAESELHFDSPFQLLVAVILSAQCTDKRVNLTTPALFAAYPDPQTLAAAEFDDVLALVRSISYPNSKARHLIGMAQKLLSDFGGQVPSGIDELMSLPGVGRKTANVVASVTWGEPVIAVDTHVFRVARRLGLSRGTTPRAVELDLERHIPEELRPIAHHWLILHGRYICTAQKPKCAGCPLAHWCKEYGA